MVRSELVELLCAKYPEIPKPTVEAATKLIFSEIVETLVRGDRVELRNFGSFFTNTLKPTMGRNPKTGEAVPLGERRAVRFRIGMKAHARLNGLSDSADELHEVLHVIGLSPAS